MYTSNSTARTPSVEENPTIAGDLSAADRSALLALARCAIEAGLAGRAAPRIPDLPAARERRGAFVSLHEAGGDLRGCIGHVMGDRPLGEVIRQVAVSAAQSDPRFAPVTPDELPGLHIEISVLSELTRVETADLCRLTMGRDGVMVRRGRCHAVLLPQVATEHGFGVEAFLSAVCCKAGLSAGSWREPATEVFTFTADVFVE
ncbi:MAG TPA: AmmeMemoRadiSam system protein A [Gemmatimonadales bacterium]|nr:AmmeMemoRadiSam system protein A [Gemmatimonadales bacterium]